MAGRHRLEDLGRIMVLVDRLLEHELFTMFDSADNYYDREELDAFIGRVQDQLYAILDIAQGTDQFNERCMPIYTPSNYERILKEKIIHESEHSDREHE